MPQKNNGCRSGVYSDNKNITIKGNAIDSTNKNIAENKTIDAKIPYKNSDAVRLI